MAVAQRMYEKLYLEASEPVLWDVDAVGVSATGLATIELTKGNVAELAPVLLRHVALTRHPAVAEELLLRLGARRVPGLPNIAVPHLAMFIRKIPEDYLGSVSTPEERTQWKERVEMLAGSVLGEFVSPDWADVFFDLASDGALGSGRFNIILNLHRTNRDDVGDFLLALIADEAVRNFVIEALGKMRYAPALAKISEHQDSVDPQVRKVVRAAVRRLDEQ